MNKLNDALKTLKNPIETCRVCFKDFHIFSFRTFIKNLKECNSCFALKEPKFIKFFVDDVKCMAIYEYDQVMKEKIYQLKGCYDIELAETFIETYAIELRTLFYGYNVVFVPSYKGDDDKRGFNHVEEIFKPLCLSKYDLLEKTAHHKQSDQKFKNRKNIQNYIKLRSNQDLSGKKILLVDDIFTTGSTIKTCISLIKKLNPKKLKVLVLCKTKDISEGELYSQV